MADSVPGSKTYAAALALKPLVAVEYVKFGDGWICYGLVPVDGYGDTQEEAFVDHVEEMWCFQNSFPPGYPN